MNISTSEYSSGCESGWTMYLDQLSNSTDHNNRFVTKSEGKKVAFVSENEKEEEDEDLSMVSDASSGPPHVHEYDENNCGGGSGAYSQYYGYYTPSFSEEKKKNKKCSNKTKEGTNCRAKKQQNLCLDDTASSPVFGFSQDNVPPSDFSQVFSSAHFEGESMTKKHLGFFRSSTKGRSGSWLGRKRQ